MPRGSIPADVERYARSVRTKSPHYTEAQVWATAWTIYNRKLLRERNRKNRPMHRPTSREMKQPHGVVAHFKDGTKEVVRFPDRAEAMLFADELRHGRNVSKVLVGPVSVGPTSKRGKKKPTARVKIEKGRPASDAMVTRYAGHIVRTFLEGGKWRTVVIDQFGKGGGMTAKTRSGAAANHKRGYEFVKMQMKEEKELRACRAKKPVLRKTKKPAKRKPKGGA